MSQVKVEVPHAHSQAEVRKRLTTFGEDLAKYGAKLVWSGERAEVQGMGVSGEVSNAPGLLRVVLKLGLAARVAGVDAGRLEASIRKRVEAALSAP